MDALPFKLKYVVLRVIQEGVTNAARHAPGEPLQLSVRQNHAGVRVVMTNRTLSTSPERIGRGIPSLKRRLAQVDGSLTIQQHEDAKFKLAAFLPYSTTKEDG
ncbi:hypothetical protein GCM10025863_23100 [Microbacterium suwonense]|uniref:Uncharacterized protein n=1 Tax=Microbacterium suwonense TaxID=683047 RepID=A0ABM8FW01_9MICO|nr:hypothetical protein GCM10025863_23100 [Microbacterium suwonense]